LSIVSHVIILIITNITTANQFDIGLPSNRQVQKWIKDQITGDLITGWVFWQDHNCTSVFDGNNEQITVWRQAIAYMKPLST
jgi:host factor-I protein